MACWLKYKQFLSLFETIFLNMNKIPLQASCESSLFMSTAQSVDSNRKAIDKVQWDHLPGAVTQTLLSTQT